MATVSLSSVADVNLGRQRSPQNHTGPSMRNYLRAANVGWDGLVLDDVKRMNFTDAEMAVFRLEPGDLLLSEASGSPREVGKPAIWQGEIEDCAFQNTLLRVRPGPSIDPRYLLHFFRHEAVTGAFAHGSRGVGIHHLGRAALSKWTVPLCSVDEQRRIAAILDHADALRAKRRQVIAQLDNLKQSIFFDMFGPPAGWPGRWPMGTIGDMVTDVQYGTSAKASDSGDWPIVRMGNLTDDGRLDLTDLKWLDLLDTDVPKYTVARGDLLFNRTNSKEKVGKTCVVDTDEGLAFAGYLVRVRLAEPHRPEFVSAFLTSRYGQAIRRSIAKTAVNQANINAKEMQSIPIALPPRQLQHEFATSLMRLEHQRQAQLTAWTEHDALFASLQSRAFRGEL